MTVNVSKFGPIERGAVIVVRGFDEQLADDDYRMFEEIVDAIHEVCDHNEFVVVALPEDGRITVANARDLIDELQRMIDGVESHPSVIDALIRREQ
ncbi:MAG TPA: hypothetical protein VIG24_10205 [Acidimicrobiia bacterium]